MAHHLQGNFFNAVFSLTCCSSEDKFITEDTMAKVLQFIQKLCLHINKFVYARARKCERKIGIGNQGQVEDSASLDKTRMIIVVYKTELLLILVQCQKMKHPSRVVKIDSKLSFEFYRDSRYPLPILNYLSLFSFRTSSTARKQTCLCVNKPFV